MASSTFDTWISSLGFFTKNALFFSVGLSALSTFGIINPGYFLLTSDIWNSFQIWRPFTAAFFFGNFSFQWLMALGMLVSYMNYNEIHDFKNVPENFAWFLAWVLFLQTLLGLAFGFMVTSFSICIALCWTFCRRNSNQQLSLFGFAFSAGMFPWALVGVHVLMGQALMPDLMGVLGGHFTLFMFDVLPAAHPMWRRLTNTPIWVRKLVKKATGQSGGPSGERSFTMHREIHPSTSWSGQQASSTTTHRWGSGRTLGAS